jgi:murein DD-endopeptidase MepM/ murein hydrolase activator NlpD
MTREPLFPNFTVPEFQLSSPKYPVCDSPVLGKITFTGGFMESLGHSRKPYTKAIFKDGNLMTLPPSNRNLGVDYVYPQNDKNIRCWYSGRVLFVGWENGYGNRCRIAYEVKFNFNGKNYPVYGAYAHAKSFNIKRGQIVSQGEIIGVEGGTGGNYPSHVDYRQWIEVNGQLIDISPNLLESQLHQNKAMIEELTVLKVGNHGNSVKWLQSLLHLKTDGIFGTETEKAVKNFQQAHKLTPDGIVGEQTAKKMEMIGYVCLAIELTIIKQEPVQSFELPEEDKISVSQGAFLPAKWVQESENNHWEIELINPINGLYNWFLFQPHFAVIKGYSNILDTLTTWEKALIECKTFGCSLATAKAEGHLTGCVATSEAIALKDWEKFDKSLLPRFNKASKKYDIPVALILALGSRESHLESILGRGNNKAGWGDNNNAFGVFQVDKRYHKIQGQHDPFSWEHLDQAMGIFNQYRSEVQKKHPDWSQSNILKGACVAYNSGVNNVRTIEGINEGTTNNDYGDDVIARAQEFFGLLVDLI